MQVFGGEHSQRVYVHRSPPPGHGVASTTFFQISQDPLVSANSISSCTLETSLILAAPSPGNRTHRPAVVEGLQEKGEKKPKLDDTKGKYIWGVYKNRSLSYIF